MDSRNHRERIRSPRAGDRGHTRGSGSSGNRGDHGTARRSERPACGSRKRDRSIRHGNRNRVRGAGDSDRGAAGNQLLRPVRPETEEASSAETTVEATEAPIETEAQPVETSAEATDVPVETEAQAVETETQAVETEAPKPTKENPEFHSGDIDVSVPFNYVPVPDRENVYMILDPEGSVIDFVIKSENEAGETTWESLVPGIVEVPELEDVYMVSKSDGSVVYLKYTRKTNSTYTFVEVDENGNPY